MPKKPTVAEFLASLRHGRAEQVERLRALILAAHPDLTEQIKWNAPSFSIDGDDRVTMRLAPGDLVQLILHRGAKVRDTTGFAFTDESGLVRWLMPTISKPRRRPSRTSSEAGSRRRAAELLLSR